jgi:hypothetical protein
MKLIYRVTIRLSLILLPILFLWAAVFYYSMVSEINDETDDSLEDYAAMLVRRTLTGEELPGPSEGSNNTYSIELLPAGSGGEQFMDFRDEQVYIPEKRETEPARVLEMTFSDADGNLYLLTVSTPTFEREDLLSDKVSYCTAYYQTVLDAENNICYNNVITVMESSPSYELGSKVMGLK